jgi:thioredoxin-related protein
MPLPQSFPDPARRQWLQQAAVACALVSPLVWAQGKDKHLPSTASLPLSLQQALQTKQPLVVMVSLEGCAFCKVVRENYLLPLQREGLPMVQINMRDKSALVGFDGTPQTQDGLIRQWGIKIAPTVLFFGERGQEVAQRLNGAYLPDFYNAYLEEQLTIARRAVLR